jgi:hypothetical protein
LHGPSRKHRFQHYYNSCMCICCRGNVFTKLLPRNGYGIFGYLAVVASTQSVFTSSDFKRTVLIY